MIDRFRSMPALSGTVLVGRAVAEMLHSVARAAANRGPPPLRNCSRR
ncbi:hypothetical protein [Streptomyces sp. NPDC059651]